MKMWWTHNTVILKELREDSSRRLRQGYSRRGSKKYKWSMAYREIVYSKHDTFSAALCGEGQEMCRRMSLVPDYMMNWGTSSVLCRSWETWRSKCGETFLFFERQSDRKIENSPKCLWWLVLGWVWCWKMWTQSSSAAQGRDPTTPSPLSPRTCVVWRP